MLDAVRVDILDLNAESVKYHTEQSGIEDEGYNIVVKFKGSTGELIGFLCLCTIEIIY